MSEVIASEKCGYIECPKSPLSEHALQIKMLMCLKHC